MALVVRFAKFGELVRWDLHKTAATLQPASYPDDVELNAMATENWMWRSEMRPNDASYISLTGYTGAPMRQIGNVQFAMSPWDVVFVFGENQTVKDNILLVEQTVRVVMSPQHAKVFNQVLTDQISKYEQAFGPIQVPNAPAQPEVQTKAKRPS